MIAIGIDLGGTNIKSAIVHNEKGILNSYSIPTEADQGLEALLGRLADVIKHASKEAPDQPIGVGIGSPGVISLDRTTVSHPPNLKGWGVVPICKELKKRTGLNTIVENDANLMALGSSRFGVGKSLDSFIMLTLGTGIGGGIIYKKQLYRGDTGGAAELGHVIINFNGPYSNSNIGGDVEAYVGQRFLIRNALEVIRQHPDNPLAIKYLNNPESLEPVHLSMEAENNNTLAIDIMAEAGRMLGYAIVNYIHILDIRKIIISGGVAKAGDWILKPARNAVMERLIRPFHDGFDIIYETLGNDAALLGAASLAFENIPTAQAR